MNRATIGAVLCFLQASVLCFFRPYRVKTVFFLSVLYTFMLFLVFVLQGSKISYLVIETSWISLHLIGSVALHRWHTQGQYTDLIPGDFGVSKENEDATECSSVQVSPTRRVSSNVSDDGD